MIPVKDEISKCCDNGDELQTLHRSYCPYLHIQDIPPSTIFSIIGRHGTDYLLWRKGSGPTVELYDILVNSERRAGRGKDLVKKLLECIPPDTRSVWAVTRRSNRISQAFYQGIGWRQVGLLRHFYRDEQDGPACDAIVWGISIG